MQPGKLGGVSPAILVVVELRAGVALPAQPRRLLARLRTVGSQYWAVWRGWPAAYLGFVVCQNVGGVQPLGVVIQQRPLLVQAVGPELVLPAIQHLPLFPTVVHRGAQVGPAVGERAMRPVLADNK